MGREVRSRFPQPAPDRSPPTLLRPLCSVWGGHSPVQGGTLSSTGSWLPRPSHLAAHTRAELHSPIRNICSPEARTCTATPGPGCPLPQLCTPAGMGSTLQPVQGTPAASGTGLQSKLTPLAPMGLNQLPKVKVTPGSRGHCGSVPAGRAAWPLPHPYRRHSSAPSSPLSEPWHRMRLSPFPEFSKARYKNPQKPNP